MSGGSLFHWFGPDTEILRQPNLSVLVRGTTRSPWPVQRSRSQCTSALTELQISCKYIGADPLKFPVVTSFTPANSKLHNLLQNNMATE